MSGDVRKTAVADGTLYAGWVKNELSFDSETFESIASTLERSFNVNIVLESSSLKDIRYSGTLENSGLENILHSFSLTSPLLYRIEDKVIYLSEDTRQIPVYKKITHKITHVSRAESRKINPSRFERRLRALRRYGYRKTHDAGTSREVSETDTRSREGHLLSFCFISV